MGDERGAAADPPHGRIHPGDGGRYAREHQGEGYGCGSQNDGTHAAPDGGRPPHGAAGQGCVWHQGQHLAARPRQAADAERREGGSDAPVPLAAPPRLHLPAGHQSAAGVGGVRHLRGARVGLPRHGASHHAGDGQGSGVFHQWFLAGKTGFLIDN